MRFLVSNPTPVIRNNLKAINRRFSIRIKFRKPASKMSAVFLLVSEGKSRYKLWLEFSPALTKVREKR